MRFWRTGGTESRTDRIPGWFFHADFYRRSDPALAGVAEPGLVEHYEEVGRLDGASPSPLFEPRYYAEQVPDLAIEDAAAHFIEEGADLGLSPHPLFDPSFYRDQAGATANPLLDYLSQGWHRGFDPHPLFSVDYYLANAPDVAEAGIEPLTHYLLWGHREQRAHHPMFDAGYYVRRLGRDVDDPLRHYLASNGAVDPTPLFSKSWYLKAAPDVADSDDPPLVHWLAIGGPAGVAPTSRGLPEEVLGLLSAARVLEAALRMRSLAPEVSGFPRRRGLSFSISGEIADPVDGVVVGGLPGVIDRSGQLVGTEEPPGRLVLSGDDFSGSVRPGGGLVIGIEPRRLELAEPRIPTIAFGAHDDDWLLAVGPAVWRACEMSQPKQVVVTVPPPPMVRRLLNGPLGLEGIRFLADGDIREVTRARVTGGDRGSLLRMRTHLLDRYASRHDDGLLVLLHADDRIDDEDRARLFAITADRKGRILTTASPLEVVLSAIGSASVVCTGAALPLVLLIARDDVEVIAFGDRRPGLLDETADWRVDVEFFESPPDEGGSPIEAILDRVKST